MYSGTLVIAHALPTGELRTRSLGKKHTSLAEALKDDERLEHMSEAQILEEFRTKVGKLVNRDCV
jgi:hypothetical protein